MTHTHTHTTHNTRPGITAGAFHADIFWGQAMQKRMQFRGVGAYSGEPLTAWLHTEDQVHDECHGEHIRVQCREVYWASVSDSRDHIHTVEVIATIAKMPGKAVPVATVIEVISHDGGHLQDDVDLAVDMIEIGAVFKK